MRKTFKPAIIAALLAISGNLAAATVVTVNGVKIDSSDIERRARMVQTASQGQIPDSPQLRQEIANELITEQLLIQEAKRLKLDKSKDYQDKIAEELKQAKSKNLDKEPQFKQQWADYQNQLLMMFYAKHLIQQKPISEQAVQQRYNELKARYQNTDEVQIGEIITSKEADAQTAINELNKKKNFSEIAKKYSQSPDVNQTGGIAQGYISLVDVKEGNPMAYQAISTLNKGQVIKSPLKEGNMNIVLYINDKRKITVPSFADVKNNLLNNMQDEQLGQAIDNLGRNAKIVPAK